MVSSLLPTTSDMVTLDVVSAAGTLKSSPWSTSSTEIAQVTAPEAQLDTVALTLFLAVMLMVADSLDVAAVSASQLTPLSTDV